MTDRLRSASRGVRLLALALFTVGALARIWPFFDGPGRYLQRFPTEDGYFMLAIGRSLALGKGLATADGTIPTNGTQPLVTLLWAGVFAVTAGDRESGVAIILGIELLFSAAAAWLLRRLGRRLLDASPGGEDTALLGAAAWYASPLVIPHTMNCLETGAYALCVLAVAHLFVEPREPRPRLPARQVGLAGLLLGVTFLVRNDAVFLIAAVCLVHVARDPRARLPRTLAFGGLSVLIASPWLVYNQVAFGSIVPVSGRAEQLMGRTQANLVSIATSLAEYTGVVLPIPQRASHHPVTIVTAFALLALAGVWLGRAYRGAAPRLRATMQLVALYAAGLLSFYGFYFGASWFVARYVFPLSPFLALAAAHLAQRALRERRLRVLGAVALLALVFGVNVRNQLVHRDHPHFHVLRWVDANVPGDAWIGAIQTGTLGFFHDRTINLDGKVNPAAYAARLSGKRGEYVVSTPIAYLVDWKGMTDWMDKPAIAASFEILLRDDVRNLGVLRRKRR